MNKATWLDAASSLARHLVTILAGMLTVALVARALGPDGLGAWSLMGTVGYLLGLGDLGLSQGIGRAHAAGDRAGVRDAARRALWVALRAGPLLGAGAVAWIALDLRALAPTMSPARLALCAALVWLGGVAFAASMPLRALLVVQGQVRAASKARAAGAAVQILALPPALALGGGLAAPCLGFALSSLVEVGILHASQRELSWASALRGPGPGGVASGLRLGGAALAVNIAVALSLRLDVAILASVAPLAALASYGVASRAVDQAFGLVKQLGVALQPRMGTARGRDEALALGASVIPPLVIGAVGALWFASEPLLRLWAGPAASGEVFAAALGLLGAGAVVAAFSEVASGWLALASPSPWRSATPILAGCAVNLLISFAGRGAFGVWAVASGTLAGNLVAAALGWRQAAALQRWGAARVVSALLPSAAAAAAALAVGPAARGLAGHGAPGALLGCSLDGGAALAAALLVIVLQQRSVGAASTRAAEER